MGAHLVCCGDTTNLTQATDLWGLVEPYLAAERLELDDLELSGRGRDRVLKVTVDGDCVDLDRLSELSRGLSRLLHDEPGLQDRYQLEVSSPGLERKLRRPSHFVKSVGREVVVKTASGDEPATYRGMLAGASDSSFTIEAERGTITVPYEDLVSARTVFRWEKAPKPGH